MPLPKSDMKASDIKERKFLNMTSGQPQPQFKPSQTVAYFGPNNGGLSEIVKDINSKNIVQSARNDVIKDSNNHQKLISDGNKQFKINKSKKMLDTARRSRIQQIEYNTTAPQGLSLVQLHSNGAPPAAAIVSSATNKTSKSKQILGIQHLTEVSRQQKFSSLISSQPAEKVEESKNTINSVGESVKKEPLRRGQIFKKQMESSENLHRIASIKNI